MDWLVVVVFVAAYLGIAAGRLPWLQVDRAWIAAAGAVVLLVSGAVSLPDAGAAIDWPAMLLLAALMVVSAEFGFAGVYGRLGQLLATLCARPPQLLAAVVLLGGGLSAILVNDIVAFAVAPLLCARLVAQGVDPRPHLIALACACNAGSAATLVGNPQNILIGQAGALDFWGYTAVAVVPSLLALAATWLVVAVLWRGRWQLSPAAGPGTPSAPPGPVQPAPSPVDGAAAALATPVRSGGRAIRPWLAVATLLALFATTLPRELSALAVAILLMASRRQRSGDYVAAVDWNLLLLFAGLFVVTGAMAQLPLARDGAGALARAGWLPDGVASIALASLAGSNVIGNVPFVILLLEAWQAPSAAQLQALAVLSTLAGNLLLIGSVVNLVVAESARRCGVQVGFVAFARIGVPVTALSMLLATAWLWWWLPA